MVLGSHAFGLGSAGICRQRTVCIGSVVRVLIEVGMPRALQNFVAAARFTPPPSNHSLPVPNPLNHPLKVLIGRVGLILGEVWRWGLD